MKILTIIGARPQFIKAAVLSRYILDNPDLGISETIVHTGQHYDQNMSDIFFNEMQIPKPDVNLNLGSGSHGKMTGEMLKGIEEILIDKKPGIVLVYGDTNSTLAGALAASKIHIPVAHVEAGLRSYMMAMPEEQNRRLTDHLSSWLFCPTQTAIQNLQKEGIGDTDEGITINPDAKRVSLVGDIMYEASMYYRENNPHSILPQFSDKDFILLIIHRAENTDDISRLANIVSAVNQCKDFLFVFPVHPRTRKILSQNNLLFDSHVTLIDPIGYFEMICYEEQCKAVVTDSGGVQKEAFFFKKLV
jgi:UDP-GlcNAc3NAcA epimerase